MKNSREIARTALLITAAVLLGYIESLFPPVALVPGIKVGIANAVIILILYTDTFKKAFTVTILKAMLCGILFGTPISFIYSISGALVSLFMMMLSKKCRIFSVIGVSSLGGIMHNMAQLICAYFFVGKGVIYYIPVLCAAGAACGAFTGCAAQIIMKRGRFLFGKE